MSILQARAAFSQLIGTAFGGVRDFYATFGYQKYLKYDDMYGKYLRQDIAGRVVDAPAAALWADPPTITSGNAVFDETWNRLTKQHDLWLHVEQVDKMAAMGKYAVLLLGFSDNDLSKPTITNTQNKLIYLQPYSVDAAEIDKLNEDPSSASYLCPEIYNIQPFKDNKENTIKIATAVTNFRAHSTRVLHVAENTLSNSIIGNPRLERVYNILDDILKNVGGTAETVWLSGNRGMHFDLDKDVELSAEDEKDLTDEIEEYQHQLRRVLRTRGVSVKNLGSDVPDPKNLFEVQISCLSGATGIPKRILTGSEAGQLASEQDRNNWADRVNERRKSFGEPVIIKPLIRKLVGAGILPSIEEEDLKIVWPDAFKLSPLERKQAVAQTARAAGNVATAVKTSEGLLLSVDQGREILGIEGDAPSKDPNFVEDAKPDPTTKVIEEKGGDNDG